MITYAFIGVGCLFSLLLFFLLVALAFVSLKKKPGAASIAQSLVPPYPPHQPSLREQQVRDKLNAIENAYLKAEQEKFEADAVAELKLLLP